MAEGSALDMITRGKSVLRQLIPRSVKASINKSRLYISHRSAAANVYHCCVHKTGSQWIKAILSDPRVYRYSGLTPYTYQETLPGGYDPRGITERDFLKPFPRHTVVTPLYIDFQNFAAMPKPERYRAFFVMRDPRDLVVSLYFSIRYSHAPMGDILQQRNLLNSISLTDGLLSMVQRLNDRGHYTALDSWADLSKQDKNVLLLRFEELTASDNLRVFEQLFSHCDIAMPENVARQLLYDYSFARLSGRKQGEEDRSAHYRKGTSGGWRDYFDNAITSSFKEVTGDLLVRLGYEQTADWYEY